MPIRLMMVYRDDELNNKRKFYHTNRGTRSVACTSSKNWYNYCVMDLLNSTEGRGVRAGGGLMG